ncbi:hypothetical protein CK203_108251 [Vitis vinifera]|uniref:Uncharacterized protein n=1 Tax=Vitis vinifera TaxID=29760 RepID=A0A438D000_VITVI|nr:hypothetical protein CK203_108251 [Vitis vinifera]
MVPDEVAPGETHPAVNVEAPNPEQESPSVASSGGDLVNDAACTSASPFSYAELEDKLKQIPPGLTTIIPSAKMFEMVETLVSGLHGMAQQHDLFSDLLRTTDYMKAFTSRHRNSEDQLRLRLAEAEAKEERRFAAALDSAKEELERELLQRGRNLKWTIKKQVDDTFIFGYRCCMKKNGIKRDVSSIPPGEEKKLLDKPAP